MQQRATKTPQPKKRGATKGSKKQPVYLALASISADATPQSQSQLPFSLPLPPEVERLLDESASRSTCSSQESSPTGARESSKASKAKRRPVAAPVAPLHLGLSDQQLVQITQHRRKEAARAARPGQGSLKKKAAAPEPLASPRKIHGRGAQRQPLAPRDEALANLLGLSSLKPSASTVGRIIDNTACLASGAARPRLAVGV